MLIHINGKFTIGKLKSYLCRKVSFLPDPLCEFRGVCLTELRIPYFSDTLTKDKPMHESLHTDV
jgi:hypothetical protein